MSSLVCLIACFALFCSFAAGAATCVQLTKEAKEICPFYNNTVEGHLPEIDRNAVIHHFKALFMTECSSLSRIFVCSTLFPLCSLTEVVLPCRDVCFSVYTACHHIYLLHRQEWPTFLNCTNLPARPQVCLFPPSTTSHLSSLSPSPSPPFASSPSSTSSSPLLTSHLSSLSPSSSPPFASSPSSSTASSPLPTSHLSSLSPSSLPPSASSTSSSPSQSSATFYSFIILAPLLFLILGLVLKRLFCCQPSTDHTVTFTANSVSYSSPPEQLSSPPLEQPQSQSQSPDVTPPPPPPPLPPKKKNYSLIYENTKNTTLYAVAEIC